MKKNILFLSLFFFVPCVLGMNVNKTKNHTLLHAIGLSSYEESKNGVLFEPLSEAVQCFERAAILGRKESLYWVAKTKYELAKAFSKMHDNQNEMINLLSASNYADFAVNHEKKEIVFRLKKDINIALINVFMREQDYQEAVNLGFRVLDNNMISEQEKKNIVGILKKIGFDDGNIPVAIQLFEKKLLGNDISVLLQDVAKLAKQLKKRGMPNTTIFALLKQHKILESFIKKEDKGFAYRNALIKVHEALDNKEQCGKLLWEQAFLQAEVQQYEKAFATFDKAIAYGYERAQVYKGLLYYNEDYWDYLAQKESDPIKKDLVQAVSLRKGCAIFEAIVEKNKDKLAELPLVPNICRKIIDIYLKKVQRSNQFVKVDFNKAEYYTRIILDNKINVIDTKNMLALIKYGQKQYNEAKKICDEIKDESDEALFLSAKITFDQHQWQDAFYRFKEVIEKSNDDKAKSIALWPIAQILLLEDKVSCTDPERKKLFETVTIVNDQSLEEHYAWYLKFGLLLRKRVEAVLTKTHPSKEDVFFSTVYGLLATSDMHSCYEKRETEGFKALAFGAKAHYPLAHFFYRHRLLHLNEKTIHYVDGDQMQRYLNTPRAQIQRDIDKRCYINSMYFLNLQNGLQLQPQTKKNLISYLDNFLKRKDCPIIIYKQAGALYTFMGNSKLGLRYMEKYAKLSLEGVDISEISFMGSLFNRRRALKQRFCERKRKLNQRRFGRK